MAAGVCISAIVSLVPASGALACVPGPGNPCAPSTPPPLNGCNNGWNCVNGSWVPSALGNTGASCDDKDPKTYNDKCTSTGYCGGTLVTCPPLPNACQGYAYNGTQACPVFNVVANTACDDGNLSTYGEVCNGAGVCTGGTPVTCPPNTTCITYAPNGTATCAVTSQLAPGTGCTDGNACTYGDTCNAAGACVGTPVTCHANDTCGTYACNNTATCAPTYAASGSICSDGDASTTGDQCSGAGLCKGNSFVHLLPDILYDVAPTQLTITTVQIGGVQIPGLPAQVIAGSPNTIVVKALDSHNQVLVGYTGTVLITSSDPLFVPVSYTFVAADKGIHTFTNVQLRRSGTRSLVVTDTAANAHVTATTNVIFDSSTVTVSVSGIPAPSEAFKLESVVVTVGDAYQNRDYFGTVQFDSTDPVADLPRDYAFVLADNGTHTFAAQLEFRTVGVSDVTAFDRDSGVFGKQTGIVVNAPAVAGCVLQPGGCCTDADCGGVLFGSTCVVAQRVCACSTGYKICRGACIPSSACCDNGDCPRPLHAGSASCEPGNSCALHCPSGTSPHDGDCVSACFGPAGDAIQ
jgi:hypothetical protein